MKKEMTEKEEKDLFALIGSVKKWAGVAFDHKVEHGTEDCPLCQLYYKNDCIGCPIWEHTHESKCSNTPYDEWWQLHSAGPIRISLPNVKDFHSQAIALEMLSFLISLLPEQSI